MRRSVYLRCLLACGCFSFALVAIACGDDSGDGGDAGSGGGGGGAGGSTVKEDPLNPDCPQKQGPFANPYGLKGDCCYRTGNEIRLESQTGDTATLEYRLNYFLPNNHPKTLSSDLVRSSTIDRFEKEEQHLLLRFTLPRNDDGEFIAGMGKAQIGAGRYNCDGTYSFYDDKAAPNFAGVTDPSRWEASTVDVIFDPEADTWQEQSKTVWKTNKNREVTYLPYVQSSGDKPLEWEAASQGFNIIEMPAIAESVNCVGSKPDRDRWMPGGKTESYQRLDINTQSSIMTLANLSLSHLLSFGAMGADMKGTPAFDPTKTPRCMPGASGCSWQKLPDSLCPVTDEEKTQWGCHVGAKDNEDGVTTNCTMTKPDGVLDPDKGATSDGQCCDPLGGGADGLPACNAFRLEFDFAAGAVDITDDPSSKVQPACPAEGGPNPDD